ncbi:ribonuclease H-like domain-containing protein [Tanacetum coccineum]
MGPLYQLEINNAFLYGDLSETVYMSLSDGFLMLMIKEFADLKKSLYELKQAPRQWNAKLTHALLENDFSRSKGNNLNKIERFKDFLKSKFQIKDLGKLKHFLGIKVLNLKRPNISYVVICLIEFMHKPLKSHLKIALKVLRYLKGSPGKGIHIVKYPLVSLENFVDVDGAKTKYLEIDLHCVREKIVNGVIKTVKVQSIDETADIFTKELDKPQHENLVSKLGLFNVLQAEIKKRFVKVLKLHLDIFLRNGGAKGWRYPTARENPTAYRFGPRVVGSGAVATSHAVGNFFFF